MVPDSDETIADRSLREETDGNVVKICTECGQELDPAAWTPTVASVDEEVTVYLFCDEECRMAWQTD
ncbi:DUF7576 family protein [Haladaptatus sp. NG-SE-30]